MTKERIFPTASCAIAYENGIDSMMAKVKEVGFEAARDEFNSIYPPGKQFPSDMSQLGKWFAFGEYEGLCRVLSKM